MTWGELFERANPYETSVERIRETLREQRGDDD